MKIKKLTVAVSAALVVAYLPAHGEDEGLGGAPEVKLRGFGTIGVVRSTKSNADVMDNLSQPRGAGYSHKWDFGVDSKLAVQADAKFNNMLSASWQVMSQRQADDTYRPHTEMGFAKLQATSDVSIRLGRVPAPLFMVSEYRKVGYVNPWVRQPNEVYFQVPYNSVDGADVSYQFSKGDFTGNLQLATGSMTPVGVPSDHQVNTLRGYQGFSSNFIGEYGPVTLRVGYSRSKNQYTGNDLDIVYGGLGKVAAYGNDTANGPGNFQNNRGLPGLIYKATYNGALEKLTSDPSFQQNFNGLQAQFPNLSTGSITDMMLASGDPKISAGLSQVVAGANLAATTYYNTANKVPSLSDAALKAQADSLHDQYAADKAKGEFLGFGIIVDPGTWLLQSEYTIRKAESFLADSRGWYITGGYRFGKFMPYISVSELKVTSPLTADSLVDRNTIGALVSAGTACQQAAPATAANACMVPFTIVNVLSGGVNKSVEGTSYGQKNISLGMRWDFLKSAALKFQWDRIDTSDYPRGTMQNYAHTNTVTGEVSTQTLGTTFADLKTGQTLETSFDRSKPVNVFSLAVDFVF